MSTIDTIGIFKGIATAHASTLSGLDVIKGHIETLRGAKITMGKSIKTCAYRQQCSDAYAQAFPKLAKKTRDNYVTALVDCVNNGAEFSLSASKGKSAPGNGKGAQKGKIEEKTGDDKMIGALLNVWKLSAIGEEILIQVETAMANDMTLIDAITDVLRAAGEPLAE